MKLKNPLRVKCAILKRVVMLLGLYEFYSFGIGSYFLGAHNQVLAIFFYLSTGLAYWLGYELSYVVQHMIIRQELGRQSNGT